MKTYRKMWEQNFGSIPKDQNGRSYEIHHIDGNRLNNHIDNLKCLSIQEHYDIHANQGDWGACNRILKRMNLTPELFSKMCSENTKKHNMKRVIEGTHNFLGSEHAKITQKKRVKNGTHNFLGGNLQSKINKKKIEEGSHHFLGGKLQSELMIKRLKNGTHPSQIKKTCEHCNKTIGSNMYARFHGNKCKAKIK